MIKMNYVYVIYCNIENANILSLFHSTERFSSLCKRYKKRDRLRKMGRSGEVFYDHALLSAIFHVSISLVEH